MNRFLVAILLGAGCATSAGVSACFDGKDWEKMQTQQPASLLYVWSPRMVLSAQNAATAQAVALAHGLRFVAVHDEQVPAAEISAALQKLAAFPVDENPASAAVLQQSQPLCSAVLPQNAVHHYPSAWVLGLPPSSPTAQAARQHPLVGAMPAFAWTLGLRQRLGM